MPSDPNAIELTAHSECRAVIKELRRLYLNMILRSVINTIYEDPNQAHWAPQSFIPELRENGRDWPSRAHSMIGYRRMANLRRLAEIAITENVAGDFIETGVWRGGACIMLRAVLKAYGISDRRVWVADSFRGLPKPSPRYPADANDTHHTIPALAVSLEDVRSNFAKYDLFDDQVCFLRGWFSETLPSAPINSLAILRLDGDMYESTMDAFVSLYDKVSHGGFIIVDDFGDLKGCQQATHEFRSARQITEPLLPIDGFGVYWRKLVSSRTT